MGAVTAKAAEVKKALVAAATAASTLLAYGLVPDVYVPYVVSALGVLGTFGVYAVTNAEPV